MGEFRSAIRRSPRLQDYDSAHPAQNWGTTIAFELRDYQAFASQKGVYHLKMTEKPGLLVLATGAGKSIIIADIVNKLNSRVLILQPSRELLQQNYDKMMSYEPSFEVGIYSASLNTKEARQVTYATIGSVVNHTDEFQDVEYVIIDEAHCVDPKNLKGQYKRFLDAIGVRRVLGLTATPYRLVPKVYWENGTKYYSTQLQMLTRIHPFFWTGGIIVNVETERLIDEGYLAPILYRQVNLGAYDQVRLNSSGTDYDRESVERYWRDDTRLAKLAQVIETVNEKCQRNLIFCSSIEQALRTQEMLASMGIVAKMVDGSTPAKERAELVSAFRAGEFKHMLNVGVFTTGFDVPELDCIILARNTMSLSLYYQMVGRGVRLDPARADKKLRVYDVVRNVENLGRVETIHITKEDDGFKDQVETERGVITNRPLFTFAYKKKEL